MRMVLGLCAWGLVTTAASQEPAAKLVQTIEPRVYGSMRRVHGPAQRSFFLAFSQNLKLRVLASLKNEIWFSDVVPGMAATLTGHRVVGRDPRQGKGHAAGACWPYLPPGTLPLSCSSQFNIAVVFSLLDFDL
jgi:hypothetical protein